MNKLKRLAESYEWVEGIASKTIIDFKKTHEMLETVFDNHFKKFDISDSKFKLLVILYKSSEGGLALSEIGNRMQVTKANITGLIDRLERQGLVKRIRRNDDRRKILAVITEKGRKFTENLMQRYREWSNEMIEVLDDNEKEQLIHIMSKLQKGLLNL